MDILVTGTGGTRGWPEPGCRCASCLRAAGVDGTAREQSTILVDGALRLGVVGETVAIAAGEERIVAGLRVLGLADSASMAAWGLADGGGGAAGGSGATLGGWEVTGPDGARLLYPARPGTVPVPPDGALPYDVAFLDVLGDPFQVGGLRARGLVTGDTTVLAAFADHRVRSAAELARRCAIWRVGIPADGARVTPCRYEPKEVYRVLVLGGARSGKSERAELRVAAEPDVTYVATGPSGDGDPDWAARVAAHKQRRPSWWRTVETTDLAGVLASASGALLIDGIGTWLAAVLDEDGWETGGLAARLTELVAAWRQTRAYVVAVSDETGLGVVPHTPAGRVFRDWLGRVNQTLAAESEEAELVVAGRVVGLEG
jgi:adenosylcobinamide kinase/adenosylcobinamide-phosphate guanylyltransferase